jgi:hypothetical protein
MRLMRLWPSAVATALGIFTGRSTEERSYG